MEGKEEMVEGREREMERIMKMRVKKMGGR